MNRKNLFLLVMGVSLFGAFLWAEKTQAALIEQNQNYAGDGGTSNHLNVYSAKLFTATTTYLLDKIEIAIQNDAPTSDKLFYLDVQSTYLGYPSNNVLGTGVVNATDTPASFTWKMFDIYPDVQIAEGQTYAIVGRTMNYDTGFGWFINTQNPKNLYRRSRSTSSDPFGAWTLYNTNYQYLYKIYSKPAISINQPIDGTTIPSPVLFNGFCTETGADLLVDLTNIDTGWTQDYVIDCINGTWDLPYQDLPNGSYVFNITETPDTASVTFRVANPGSLNVSLWVQYPATGFSNLFYLNPYDSPFNFRFAYNAPSNYTVLFASSTTSFDNAQTFLTDSFSDLDSFGVGLFDVPISFNTGAWKYYLAGIYDQGDNLVYTLAFKVFGDPTATTTVPLNPLPQMTTPLDWSCPIGISVNFFNFDFCALLGKVTSLVTKSIVATVEYIYYLMRSIEPWSYGFNTYEAVKTGLTTPGTASSTLLSLSWNYEGTNIELFNASTTPLLVADQSVWDKLRQWEIIGIFLAFIAYLLFRFFL